MDKMLKIKDAISKTGFLLEYKIGMDLQKKGWKTISNRYYLDDLSGIPREIDILAYKRTVVKNLLVYTCLLISCKKSEDKDWVFLTKQNDPNQSEKDRIVNIVYSTDEREENRQEEATSRAEAQQAQQAADAVGQIDPNKAPEEGSMAAAIAEGEA